MKDLVFHHQALQIIMLPLLKPKLEKAFTKMSSYSNSIHNIER